MQSGERVLIVEDQYFVAVDCELQLRSVGIECVGLATTAADIERILDAGPVSMCSDFPERAAAALAARETAVA